MNPVMQALTKTVMADAKKNVRVNIRWEVKGKTVFEKKGIKLHSDPLHPMALCTASGKSEFTEKEHNGEILEIIFSIRYKKDKYERRTSITKTEQRRVTKIPPYTLYFGDLLGKEKE